jgi:NhaP-type Na+/H+ and K+/H+ antiporters
MFDYCCEMLIFSTFYCIFVGVNIKLMSVSMAIIALGCLIFLSHIFNALFERTKIPSVIFLICIGIFSGPMVMNWATPAHLGNIGNIFTTITLIVILFESGTGLHIYDIKKSIGRATALTVTCFVTVLIISTFVIFVLTNLDIMSCVFIGSVVGGTAVGIVIPIVKQLKLTEKTSTILFLESALSGVLSLIVGLAILDSMQYGGLSIMKVLMNMIMSLVIASAFGAVLGFAWTILHDRFLKNIKNMMFASFALAFIIYGICDQLKLNGGTAVLVYGIVVGNIDYFSKKNIFKRFNLGEDLVLNENQRTFFSEIGFVLQTYFFVYVGICLKFSNANLFAISMILTTLIFIVRQFITKIIISKKTAKFEKEMISIMTPKGLIAAVMASLPLQYGLTHGEEIQGIVYCVVFISILLCSFLAANLKHQKRKIEFKEEKNKVINE